MKLELCFGRHSSSSMMDGPGQVRWDAEKPASCSTASGKEEWGPHRGGGNVMEKGEWVQSIF